MTVVAALCAAVAAWLGLARSAGAIIGRLAVSPDRSRKPRRRFLVVLASATLAGVGMAALIAGTQGIAVGLATACVAVTVAVVVGRHRVRRRVLTRMKDVSRACEVLAALVRTGHVPAAALALAAGDSPVLAIPAAVQLVGGDPVAALKQEGKTPGAEGLTAIAQAWEVSAVAGAPIVATLDAVTDQLRAVTKLAHLVDSELAAPRATGKLLAILPFAGLALGLALGGDPVGFLTTAAVGQVCLVAGVGMACAGVLWSDTLADRAASLAVR